MNHIGLKEMIITEMLKTVNKTNGRNNVFFIENSLYTGIMPNILRNTILSKCIYNHLRYDGGKTHKKW